MLRVINGDTVRALYSIADAVPDMEHALMSFSDGSAYQHPRITVEPPGARGLALLMPAMSADTLGVKLLSMFPRACRPTRSRPRPSETLCAPFLTRRGMR